MLTEMPTLVTIANMLNWRLTESAPYDWDCYGPNCRYFDFWNEFDYSDACWQISLVVDTATTAIREITGRGSIFSLVDNPWKWIDPTYIDAYLKECDSRNVKPNQAWDSVNYNIVESIDEAMRYVEMVKTEIKEIY